MARKMSDAKAERMTCVPRVLVEVLLIEPMALPEVKRREKIRVNEVRHTNVFPWRRDHRRCERGMTEGMRIGDQSAG